MHVLTKLCVFRGFLFLSFPSDRDSSTTSSVNKIRKTASRSGSPALNDPTLTNPLRNYPYNINIVGNREKITTDKRVSDK